VVQVLTWCVAQGDAETSDRVAAEQMARAGLEPCRDAGDPYWTASVLNLLADIALHTGRPEEAARTAAQALSIAQAAGWP
jgi:hypothetical protein